MYNAKVLQYFREPKRVGVLEPPAVRVEVTNPICGDILRLSALVEAGRVVTAAFQAKGCTASIAAGAALADWVEGKRLAEVGTLRPADVEDLLEGLPNESKHAAVLAADAAKALLKLFGEADLS